MTYDRAWENKLTLPHDNTAHKHLNWPDSFKRNLPLTGGLVETELVSELILADGHWVIDLVPEDKERNLGQFLHGQKGVELGFGFSESLTVHCVD